MITGEVGVYLLKASTLLILLYIFNKLLLSRETLHRLNRFVWLAVLAISFTAPLIQHHSESGSGEGITSFDIGQIQSEVIDMEMGEASIRPPLVGRVVKIALWIYIIGVAVILLYNIISYLSLLSLLYTKKYNIDNSREQEDEHLRELFEYCSSKIGLSQRVRYVIHEREYSPFSWMNFVVVSRRDLATSGRDIIMHELSHVKQMHSIDILLANIATIVLWFNPASWLTKRAMQQVHEYCADESVLSVGVNAKEYQLLLIKKAIGSRLYSVSNSLNHSNLKDRITMMTKKRSKGWSAAKILYILPLALGSVSLFASPTLNDHFNTINEVKISNNKSDEQALDEKLEAKIAADTTRVAPLYVVDGLERSSIEGIDSNSIKSVSVLKDEAATAIYGDKGKNGVVIVSLKAEGTYSESSEEVKVIGDGVRPKSESPEPAEIQFDNANTILYIVDGQVVELEHVNAIEPDAIEKISVFQRDHEGYENLKVWEQEDISKYNGVCSINTKGARSQPFLRVEAMPKFQDGDLSTFRDWVMRSVSYPEVDVMAGVEGNVIASFIIDEEGFLTSIEILQSPSETLSEEVRRVFNSSPIWTPGEQRGNKVAVKYTLPVQFSINNEE